MKHDNCVQLLSVWLLTMIAIIKPRNQHPILCTFTNVTYSCVSIWLCWFCCPKYFRSFEQNLYRKQDFERPGEKREKLRDKSTFFDENRMLLNIRSCDREADEICGRRMLRVSPRNICG